MSIYDRDYMRRQPRGDSLLRGAASLGAAKCLIGFNVAVFFLSALFPGLFAAFALSPQTLGRGMVWQILTYSFLHGGFLHILCNMLGLYFIGPFVESRLGWKRFLLLYFLGAILGALAWLGVSWGTHDVLVGASAGVMAVVAYFCLSYPPMPLTFLIFFIIPVRLKPRPMLGIIAAIEVFGLLYSLAGGSSDVAYAAHLGGLAAGGFFYLLQLRGAFARFDSLGSKISAFALRGRKSCTRKASEYKFSVDISGDTSAEVDRILDKISEHGFASLTDSEREFLHRVSAQKRDTQ